MGSKKKLDIVKFQEFRLASLDKCFASINFFFDLNKVFYFHKMVLNFVTYHIF